MAPLTLDVQASFILERGSHRLSLIAHRRDDQTHAHQLCAPVENLRPLMFVDEGVTRPVKHHIRQMEQFNYVNPADIFVGGGRTFSRFPMSYRRFATGAEAVRYAIELQDAEKLVATVIEVDEARFDAAAIRRLYDCEAYPLPRLSVS